MLLERLKRRQIMYRSIPGFLLVLTINLFAGVVFAAESPVILSHSITGFNKVEGHNKNKGSAEITFNYTLHVENPGETPLGDLSLSLVSRPPLVSKKTTVRVDYLGPHQSADIQLKVVTREVPDPDKFVQKTLSWAGKCLDADGKQVEFPVKSRPGGAK